jgi:GH35 family endo-1,4-beta-xylanase
MKKTVTVTSLAILLLGAAPCVAEQNVPALKDVFKADFLIGGALNRNLVTGRDPNAAALVEKHFSTITAENDLKWQRVHPQPDQYNWEPADSYVAFGENHKMFVIGQVSRANTNDPTAAAAETQKKLADKYAEIFSVLLKHKKEITRVTFWGVYDRTSWIGGSPLLFDRDDKPKEAFFAVVKTAQRQ